MRPPEQVKRELIQQWLAKAEEDFRVVEYLLSEDTAYLSAIGFHAQQAAEKYLKAFLVLHQIEFPKTHNLGELLDLFSQINPSLALSLRDITALNPYGVDIRYPADFPEMTMEDAREALKLAAKTRDAIRAALKEFIEEGSSDA